MDMMIKTFFSLSKWVSTPVENPDSVLFSCKGKKLAAELQKPTTLD